MLDFSNPSKISTLIFFQDLPQWRGEVERQIKDYEKILKLSLDQGFYDRDSRKWSFMNAMFYCGTIYTTIGK